MKQLPCISLLLSHALTHCLVSLCDLFWLHLRIAITFHMGQRGQSKNCPGFDGPGVNAYAYWSLVELPRPQEWLILGMTDGHPHPSAARKMLGSPNEESFKMNPSAHPKPMKSFCLGFLGGKQLEFLVGIKFGVKNQLQWLGRLHGHFTFLVFESFWKSRVG